MIEPHVGAIAGGRHADAHAEGAADGGPPLPWRSLESGGLLFTRLPVMAHAGRLRRCRRCRKLRLPHRTAFAG